MWAVLISRTPKTTSSYNSNNHDDNVNKDNNGNYYTFKLHSCFLLVDIYQLILNVRKPWHHFRRISWISIYLADGYCFCTIWLVPLCRNILHYSPPSKTTWRPVLFTLRKKNLFSINEVALPENTKKEMKFGNNYSNICISFIFLAINALRMCFKMFWLQMISGRQADIP